ncbi:MAG TPA: DUF805 domain-containing protein [Thiobacillaceae bacterium]|nr:DUF805 domain-containing protein [Thiobacillaceae bacterium]
MEWFVKVVKSFSFQGRARRKEYWMFVLFAVVITFVLGLLDGILGTYSAETGIGLLGVIFTLGILIQSIAVGVRRLHDTGRSGWWLLINFIPFVGWLIVIVLLALDGQRGENRFGADPKQTA